MSAEQDPSDRLANLRLLHQGEEAIRAQSLLAIEASETLTGSLATIECVMDMLQFYRMSYPALIDDLLTIHLLGFRLFNAAASAVKLMLGGYYQASGLHIRDILETAFLLDYFSMDEAAIQRWRSAKDESERNKEFGPVKIRIALDKRDGFVEERRKGHYKLLCELATHPTVAGFRMLQPKAGANAECGCFFASDLLTGSLQELTRTLLVSWESFQCFFAPQTLVQHQKLLNHLELSRDWWQETFGSVLDRNDVVALRAIIYHLANGGNMSDLRAPYL